MNAVELGYGLLVVLLSVGGGYFGNRLQFRTAQQAAAIEQERVDGEAYDRARGINDGIVASLTGEIERLQVKVHELTTALDSALDRARSAERDRDHYRATLEGPHGNHPTVAGGTNG